MIKTKRIAIWSGVAVSAIALVFSWAVSSAPGGSPDEPAHFISIYCLSERYQDSCKSTGEGIYDLSPVKNISDCYLYQRDKGVACEVSNLYEQIKLNSNAVFSPFTVNNYYKALSIFTSDFFILSLLAMRIFNGFIFLIIALLAYLLFPKDLRPYFLFSTLIMSTPLALYIVTSINTSAWLIIGLIGTWSSLFALLHDIELSKSNLRIFLGRLLLLFFSIYISMSSRFDGFYFVLITIFIIAFVFASPNIVAFFKRFFSTHAIYTFFYFFVITGSLLLLFYFRSKSAIAGNTGRIQNADRVFENIARLPHLLLGPFGTWGLGWLDVWLSPITYSLTIITVLGVAFMAIKNLNFAYSTAVSILSLGVVSLPLLVLQSSGYSVGEWVQPRYVLPLYFPLFGLLVTSMALNKTYLSKFQSSIALLFVAIAHSFALFANLERYIRGQNTVSLNLEKNLVWWWDQLISPNIIWIVGSVSFAILSTITYKVIPKKL